MDTSKNYIKMCEKAKEIQDFWKPSRDDKYVYAESSGDTWQYKVHTVRNDNQYMAQYHMTYVWLPRQDQLQEMVSKDYDKDITRPWVHLCYEFYKWAHLNWTYFNSMEQLWLAFVMKKRYNKVWDGETWIIKN